MIRVLLAEDQSMLRSALAALLALQDDIAVVAEAARGDEAMAQALATQPDVALLDIEIPGLDGLRVASELHQRLPTCRILMLTTFGRPGYLRRAMESGAAGFLLKDAPPKDAPPDELAHAIRRAVAGERVVDPALALSALSEGASPLTERERTVLRSARFGASVADIAAQLALSEGTVANYLSSAMQKTGARNRVEAAHIAEEKGWL